MAKYPVPYLALVLSALACVLSIAAWMRDEPRAAPARELEPGLDPGRLGALETEVAALRAELEAAAAAAARSPPREPVAGEPRLEGDPLASSHPASPPREWTERIAKLESALGRLQSTPGAGARQLQAAPELLDRAEAASRATDPLASEEQRIAGLRALRGWRGSEEARTHDVVLSMIDFAERSPNAEARADVWRNLHGVTDPVLRDPLLRALASDPDGDVREEAAETLDRYLPDREVEAALRYAAENDSDKGVRRQAAESLAGGG